LADRRRLAAEIIGADHIGQTFLGHCRSRDDPGCIDAIPESTFISSFYRGGNRGDRRADGGYVSDNWAGTVSVISTRERNPAGASVIRVLERASPT
jgi:hypothetical protein